MIGLTSRWQDCSYKPFDNDFPATVRVHQEIINKSTDLVELVDVGLSYEELDLVVGVYNYYQGMSFHYFGLAYNYNFLFLAKNKFPGRISWWPSYGNWNDSGRDVRRWTSDCEDWYQKTLVKINSSHGLIQSKQWRKMLRLRPETRQITSEYKSLCVEFVSGAAFM